MSWSGLSMGSLLAFGMKGGRTDPRPAWGLWVMIALMALFFGSMREMVWAFLAIWSTIAVAAPALARRSVGKIVPPGALLLAVIPMMLFAAAILIGLDPTPDGAWENLLATITYYTVAFVTILSLCVGTSMRLNWTLLNWSVMFLGFTLCSLTIILQFLSDHYMGSDFLSNDNRVAMVQLAWAYFGCILIGVTVKRYGRPALSIYQPLWKKPPEVQA